MIIRSYAYVAAVRFGEWLMLGESRFAKVGPLLSSHLFAEPITDEKRVGHPDPVFE